MKRTAIMIHLLALLLTAKVMSQEKLYVFYPTTARPQAMQDKMTSTFDGVAVTVFGRYNDFTAKIGMEPPDAVVTKPALIEQLGGYTISLNAERKGKVEESYVLMSINTPLEKAGVNAETVIGAIDLLGRSGMKPFTEQFFSVEPKIKRVTKVEDLLPLLSFNMAAGILIEDVFVNYFKTTSQLQFSVTPLTGAKGGILALAVKSGGKADKAIAALKKNDKELCGMFEVDLWK